MRHKAKNKPEIDVKSDPILGESVSISDERKTVILDEDLQGLDFEERMWLYWKRNKNFIILMIVCVFAVVIGTQGWKFYKASAFNSLAESYETAQSPEELSAFAKAHAGTVLAGVASLQNADASYKAKDYAKAGEFYSVAEKNLKGDLLLGRAKMGSAMCLIQSGKVDEGKAALKAVAADISLNAPYRAEATYSLGLLAKMSGDKAGAKTLFESVATDVKGGIWAQLAQESLSEM